MNEPRRARSSHWTSRRAERIAGALLVALAAAAPFGCSNCSGNKAAKLQRQVAPHTPALEGPPREPPQLPSGEPMTGESFSRFAPDSVAGFTAEGPGQALSSPLANGGKLTTFSRNYKRGPITLRVEYSDGLHAPLLAKVIQQRQGTESKTELNEFRGTAINGNPAVLQFQAGSRTAYANVLIAGRVLLNVRVIPADDLEAAVEVASALPLADVALLVPAPDGGTAPPSAEPEGPAPGEGEAERPAATKGAAAKPHEAAAPDKPLSAPRSARPQPEPPPAAAPKPGAATSAPARSRD